MKILEDTPAVLSLGKLYDEHGYSNEWINGQKTTFLKMVFDYSAIRNTSYQSWFLVYQRVLPQACLLQHRRLLQVKKLIIQITTQQSSQVKVWIDKHGETRTLLKHQKSCYMNQPKNEDHEQVRGSPYSDIPEWLQEFRENLVDERVPEHRDSHASSSHEPSLEPVRSVYLGKHSVYTHLPKDRNCEICQRTKITRAPYRRRRGRVVTRALQQITKFSVKDVNLETIIDMQSWCKTYLATQWIQSYPCKTKTSQETERSLRKFLEP